MWLELDIFWRKTSSLEVGNNDVQLEEVQESEGVELSNSAGSLQEVDPPFTVDAPLDPRSIVEEPPEDVQTLRRSGRSRQVPNRWYGESFLIEDDEPATYGAAMKGPDNEKWLEAMKSEIDSMYQNDVWTLMHLPEGARPIECKWVFKKKLDKDGNVHIYKARLVAKGFKQIHGIDYDETYSPVAMFKSIRIILAIAAFHDYEIWQMDVKTAFLNGNLEEDVYMTQPPGFASPEGPEMVCKLQRSIYGLKQASRSWNLRFNKAIKEFGFVRSEEEPCVYKKVSGRNVAFIVLYVDDILIIGDSIPLLESVKAWLCKCFSMKDLGEAQFILGIKIYRDRANRLIGLSQDTYIDKVLQRFDMIDSKKGLLPMTTGTILNKGQSPTTDVEKDKMSSPLCLSHRIYHVCHVVYTPRHIVRFECD